MTPPIRVYVLTGFLGSGKTTLLNRLLADPATPPIAVIVNEYGAVGLDHLLLAGSAGDPVLLANGCICCAVRSDLSLALQDLLLRRATGALPPFETVVIETTGLAEPGPILRMLLDDPALAGQMLFGGTITAVDACLADASVREHPVARAQIAAADRLIVTKSDLADPAAAIGLIRSINAAASISIAVAGEGLDAGALFATGLYNPATRAMDLDRWLRVADHGGHDHHHDRVEQYCLTLSTPVPRATLDLWIAALGRYRRERILRVKAIVAIAEHPDRPVVFHAVQGIFQPPVMLARWPGADHDSRICVIATNFGADEARAMLDLLQTERSV